MIIKKLKIVGQFFPVFAGLLLVGLTLMLWHNLVQFEEQEISKLEGGSVSNEIQSQMTARVKALERMAKRWGNGDTPDRREWEFEAALNLEDFGGYQAISFIDDSMQVKWVVPFVGNEAVENADLSTDAVRKQAFEEARRQRTTVITSQVNLIQGGRGFLVVIPVFTGEKSDGYILGVFRTNDFFDTVLEDKIAPGFAVAVFEDDEEIYTRLKVSDQQFSHLTQQSEFNLRNKRWKILVQPTEAVFQKEDSLTDEITLVSGLMVAFFFGLTVFQIQQSNRKKGVIGAANQKLEQEMKMRQAIETQFRALLNAMTETIFVLDKDGYIYQIGAVETNGGAESSKNNHLGDLFSGETADEMLQNIAVTLETGKPTKITYTTFGKGGRIFSSIISPMSANRVVLVGRDVTEQKAVEAQMRASEANYRDLFDNATDLIHSVGADGAFLYVNEAWLAALGYRQEELNELLLEDIIHPNEAERYAEILQQIGDGQSGKAIETKFITSSGETLLVEGNLNTHHEPGKGLSTRGIFRDITERRKTENTLEKLRRRYETILKEAGEGILGIDSQSRITFANPRAAQMLGYEVEEMLGRFQYEILYLSEVDCIKCDWETSRIFKTLKESVSQEAVDEKFTRRDGTNFPVEYTSNPIQENGATVGAVIIFKDATERVRLEETQRQATQSAVELTQAKSQFVARVSHELRTPISGVIGMTGLLLNTRLTKRQMEYGQMIDKSASSLLMLINDLLDFSKIEAHKLELFNEPFVLEEVIQNCLNTSAVQAAAKNLDIIAVNEIKLLRMISGDAFRLQQILNNLIGNAVKFTERGEVVVSVMQDYETFDHITLRFTVADTGSGIDRETGSSLFKPFAQGSTEINLRSGTGLGLYISRQLVEMLGGEIGFESEPGKGTTFWFTAVFGKWQPVEPASEIINSLAGRRILISLDNPQISYRAALQTTFWGMEAVIAETDIHAVELLRESSPAKGNFDVMLVEDNSALFGDSDFLNRISYEAAHKPVKTILLVPLSDEVSAHKDTLHQTADAYLTKPLFYWSLFQTINTVLQKDSTRHSTVLAPEVIAAIAPMKPAQVKKSLSVLVAEDNEINQKVIRYQLEELGHEVTLVGDGRQAVESVEVFRYDVLLMDCHMPLMDGFAAAREIRRQETENGSEKSLIYALTATVNENIEEECLAAGMNGYFSKPLDVKILSKLLAGVDSSFLFLPANDAQTANGDQNSFETVDFGLPIGSADSVLEKFIEQSKNRRPELMTEIVGIFLRDTPNRLAQLEEAVADADFGRIEQESHRLRGTALNLGFDRMAEICEKMESLKSVADVVFGQSSALVYLDGLKHETAIIVSALRGKYDGKR